MKRLKYGDGSVYVGAVDASGNRHGDGEYTLPSGSKYVGQFQSDVMHGKGRFTIATGNDDADDDGVPEVYEGEFVDGIFHGHGKYLYSDGSVYEGEWREGAMHGRGRYEEGRWGAGGGDVYEGEYVCDEKHGFGIYISAADGCRYEGQWREGAMHGHGVHVDSKGAVYEGEFCANKMHGQGVMTVSDGHGGLERASGTWVRGERVDGDGKVLHSATDPSSNPETLQKAVSAAAAAMRSNAQFRHPDSRVTHLPDEEF